MTPTRVQTFDAAIVGAGPAGSSAALALAGAGLNVALIEKCPLPRYKTCGGGLLPRARRLLPAGLETVIEREFHSVGLRFVGLKSHFNATREEPLISMTQRAALDSALAAKAEQAGARLLLSNPVHEVTEREDAVEIATDQATLRARFLIAADGAASFVAKRAGWPELPTPAPALECELRLPETEFKRLAGVARFDFDLPAHGYAWVFPKHGHLSVGVMTTRRGGVNLNLALEDYLRHLGVDSNADGVTMEKHGWQIPLTPRPGPLARGRILLVGDAAGLVDPITAEGISNALISGRLAAQALTEGRLDAADCARRYQALLQAQLLPDLQAARLLARLLYRPTRFRNWALRRGGQRLAEFMADVVLGHASYRAALIRPRSYLRALGW